MLLIIYFGPYLASLETFLDFFRVPKKKCWSYKVFKIEGENWQIYVLNKPIFFLEDEVKNFSQISIFMLISKMGSKI